jgi:hypothetical protein
MGGANHQPKLPPPPFSFFFFFNFFFFHLLFPSLFASFTSSRRAAVPPVLGVELTFQIASKHVRVFLIFVYEATMKLMTLPRARLQNPPVYAKSGNNV